MTNFLKIIKFYCYPNVLAPKKVYETMDSEFKSLLLDAAEEFFTNVRYKQSGNVSEWISHERTWEYLLKK